MAKFKLAEIPEATRARYALPQFYSNLWQQIRSAANVNKAVIVDVPSDRDVLTFASNIRQNACHRIGAGKVGVQRVPGKRQLLVWLKAVANVRE